MWTGSGTSPWTAPMRNTVRGSNFVTTTPTTGFLSQSSSFSFCSIWVWTSKTVRSSSSTFPTGGNETSPFPGTVSCRVMSGDTARPL